ncbi:MAG: YolA family protein [Helicobacter sp.]|uniref:DUF4879 domain-containing protein n=1 Tax=Helicobacter sp. TaxID=218 RepID=UPI0023C2D461|nr:DUF4879 domain-containing protein [Helicobacter sp.]MDE5926789.1 YolA family protein [Helicobacter sp.]MDE7174600.1 YolA family protein [Helicobacter sp.]
MARKVLSLALASVLSCGIAFGADNYTTEGKEKITRNGLMLYVEANSPHKQKILSGEFDKSLDRMKKAYKENKNNEATKAAAPPVSAVYILFVCSQQMKQDTGYDCEEIQDNQTSTGFNHGGNPFEVDSAVEGYGGRNTDSATFAGNQATMSYITDVADNNNVVIGWLETWDISKPNNTNGTFTYTARSINVGPTMSTSIYIK